MKQPSIVDALSKAKPKPKPSSSAVSKSIPSKGEAKVQRAPKRKQVISDDSDSDSGDLMSRIMSKTTAEAKVCV